MPKYAIILSGIVENVEVWAVAPTKPGRTVVLLSAGQVVSQGDSYDGSAFTPRVPSARETTQAQSPENLRQAYTTLRQWSQDAQATYNAAVAGNRALTAAEQREFIRRVGVFFDRMADLLIRLDFDQ